MISNHVQVNIEILYLFYIILCCIRKYNKYDNGNRLNNFACYNNNSFIEKIDNNEKKWGLEKNK
jgi:hypothetical protein